MHDQLLNLIGQKVVLTDNDKELCKKYFEPVLFPKNRIIEHEGQSPKISLLCCVGFYATVLLQQFR